MSYLSFFRGFHSDSSEHTTSAKAKQNSRTQEDTWTPFGRYSEAECKSLLITCSALPDTKRMVVQTAVTNLFEQQYFNICSIDKILKILEARQGGRAYELLHALHCIHYDKMPQELRNRIPYLVNECLSQTENVIDVTQVALKGIEYEH